MKQLYQYAVKLIWWTVTLQLAQRLRLWWAARHAHFAPPTDSYHFAVPFNYAITPPDAPSVAVMCHLFYPDMLSEFKPYLLNIPFAFDLFITTDTEQKQQLIQQNLLDWHKGTVEIRLVPNRGRDIAPKLLAWHDVYPRYEFFLHIHSKKSPHADSILSGWRNYLLNTLLGSEAIVNSIFAAFNSDAQLGMIAPEHFAPVRSGIGWGTNFAAAETFARDKLAMHLSLEGKIDFPSGSMFWARSAAIKPLLDLNLSIDDFQPEQKQMDGTLAHIIERLYFFICEQAGYRWIKIANPALHHNDKTLYIDNQEMLIERIKRTQYAILPSTDVAL